jgi:PAS domain S-box-containing protein
VGAHISYCPASKSQAIDNLRKTTDSADIVSQASAIVSTYLQPGLATEVCLSESLKTSIISMAAGERVQTNNVLIEAQHETVRIMAMGAFPRFVESAGFIKYRALNHISDPAIQARMSVELDALVANTSWLGHFITSVERLPVGVSIAAANKELSGFPLVYVNAAFESTTGYPREEIIGKNCRFLQMGRAAGQKSEEEGVSLMSKALREGKQVKVAITNFKKDGSPFRNVLALKPIFNQHGKYAFVVSIQFDIGDKQASPKKMKIIDDLFKILPSSTKNSFL